MRNQNSLFVWACLLSAAGWVQAAEVPMTASPGYGSHLALIGDPCPTFSWGEVEGARRYELVVYRLGRDGEDTTPVLRQRLPGSVVGWTPSLDACLERGGRYAWSVRAVGRRGASEWSEPRLFEVASRPSEREFELALDTVERYLAVRDSAAPEAAGASAEPATRSEASAASDSAPARPFSRVSTGVSLVTDGDAMFGGQISGDGSGLTSVNADTLDSMDSSAFSTGSHTTDTTCNGLACNGALFTNVDAEELDGLDSLDFTSAICNLHARTDLPFPSSLSCSCRPVDGQCVRNDHCCSNRCESQQCCKPPQQTCSSVAECCSGLSCSGGECCVPLNGSCTSTAQCCGFRDCISGQCKDPF